MTPVEIGEAYAGIKTAAEYVKSLMKLNNDVKVNQVAIKLQQAILDLQFTLSEIQSKYQDLAEVKRETEQKLLAYEKWESEASRYELKEVASGIFVYSLKPSDAKDEPLHWLCPNCFQTREKSILGKSAVDYLQYKCVRCTFKITPTSFSYPKTDIEPDYGTDWGVGS